MIIGVRSLCHRSRDGRPASGCRQEKHRPAPAAPPTRRTARWRQIELDFVGGPPWKVGTPTWRSAARQGVVHDATRWITEAFWRADGRQGTAAVPAGYDRRNCHPTYHIPRYEWVAGRQGRPISQVNGGNEVHYRLNEVATTANWPRSTIGSPKAIGHRTKGTVSRGSRRCRDLVNGKACNQKGSGAVEDWQGEAKRR